MMFSNIENLARDIAISIGVVLLLWGFGRLLFLFIEKLSARYLGHLLSRKLKAPFISLVILFGAYIAFHRLGIQDKTIFIVDNIFFILAALFSMNIGYDLIKMGINWYSEGIASKTPVPLDDKFLPLVDVTVKIFVILTGLLIIMGHFNYNLSSVIAAMGLGSLAIGLAAKDTLANMISGFIIMIDQPFKLNDRIKLASGKTGNVISIGLRSVRLKDPDNNVIIIPNTELVNMQLINLSQPDTRIRHQLKIVVAYGTNLERARKILIEAARQAQWVLKDPPPDVLFAGFGKLGLTVNLRFWVEVEQLEKAVDFVNTGISRRFREEGIQIPFQSHLILHSSPVQEEAAKGGDEPARPPKQMGTLQ